MPLAARIRKQLEEELAGTRPEALFIELLEQLRKAEEASRVLEVAVERGVTVRCTNMISTQAGSSCLTKWRNG